MSTSHNLLAGTTKGLVVYDLQNPQHEPAVHFTGLPISTIFVDKETWWVGISHRHWGEKLHFSRDRGVSWQVAGLPSFHGYDYRPGQPATLKRLWVMQSATKPGCYWVGTEPGGLFYSDDDCKTFQLNESLWNHPSRMDDQEWFGTGKDFPFIHSIIVDPRNSDHVYVGVSCAGVFETTDGGKTWTPRNDGLVAGYLPKAHPDVGHDPHQMLLCQLKPEVMWQQNHCGIFRTTNGAKHWDDVSGKNSINLSTGTGTRAWPSYGFALAIDNTNPDVAWVIPAESDESRIPAGLKLQVMKTIDGGKSWNSVSNGLPKQQAFDLVLRHGFVKHENVLAFGTTNGNVYCSFDESKKWDILSQNLAPVTCLAIS
jgi:hypothetical protein